MNELIDIYRKQFNLQKASITHIDHEDAMVAKVFKVSMPSGEELILKISDHARNYFREVFFLKQFSEILPIPKIINLTAPYEEMQGAILMNCLPGTLLDTSYLRETLAFEIGKNLALIHTKRFPAYGDPIEEMDSDPRSHFTLKFEEGIEECKEHLPKFLIEKCINYHNTHLNILTTVDGPCVVHRDFRPGNIIVCKGKLEGIIDWAGARVSFAEEDFCSFENEEWLISSTIKNALLAGYATVRSIPNYERLIPFLRINKAVAILGFTIKRGTWNGMSSRLYQYNRQFLESFLSNMPI